MESGGGAGREVTQRLHCTDWAVSKGGGGINKLANNIINSASSNYIPGLINNN